MINIDTIITVDLEEAGKCLANGGLVIFPTETVYGIGADSYNWKSCQKIYEVKNRPRDNPFIIHVHDVDTIFKLGYVKTEYEKLIKEFSPGPITYILSSNDPGLFSCNLPTVGLRVPSHKECIRLLKYSNIPISAPSANISGKPSITRHIDVVENFYGKVDMIFEASAPEVGIESTVIDLSNEPPLYLRPGEISFDEVQKFIPGIIRPGEMTHSFPKSPGLKYRHYAPDCDVIICETFHELKIDMNSARIGFEMEGSSELDFKISSNLEYMKNLYSFLNDCDKEKVKVAYCQVPKNDKYYEALMNRLTKASLKK